MLFSWHQPGHPHILSKILTKVARLSSRELASSLAVQGRVKRNREGKYLDGSGENEKKKKKVWKKRKRYKVCREEMDVTEELKIVGLLL